MQFFERLNSEEREIHENALSCAKVFVAAEAKLLSAIMEVDRLKLYEKFGETYLTPYCVKYLNLTEHMAGAFVTVGRKSVEVPQLKIAIDEGLSVSKAKAIVSVITKENQELWIEKAQTETRAKVEREVANTKRSKVEPEKVKFKPNDGVRMSFDLSCEETKEFRRAQELVSTKLGRIATIGEIYAFLVKGFLKKEDPVVKADRAKTHAPRGASRKMSTAIKHEVFKRDRGQCQARYSDGSQCQERKWVHLHHIKPQSEGGQHASENLITLCSAHHRQHHRH